jgi:hypothetical protein
MKIRIVFPGFLIAPLSEKEPTKTIQAKLEGLGHQLIAGGEDPNTQADLLIIFDPMLEEFREWRAAHENELVVIHHDADSWARQQWLDGGADRILRISREPTEAAQEIAELMPQNMARIPQTHLCDLARIARKFAAAQVALSETDKDAPMAKRLGDLYYEG